MQFVICICVYMRFSAKCCWWWSSCWRATHDTTRKIRAHTHIGTLSVDPTDRSITFRKRPTTNAGQLESCGLRIRCELNRRPLFRPSVYDQKCVCVWVCVLWPEFCLLFPEIFRYFRTEFAHAELCPKWRRPDRRWFLQMPVSCNYHSCIRHN